MLSIKRKETLLRVQCTGNSYQYFSSKVKTLHVTWTLFVAFYLKFSLSPFWKCMCFSTLRTENVGSNVAWDVRLSVFSSVLYVAMLSVRESIFQWVWILRCQTPCGFFCACLRKRWGARLSEGVETSTQWFGVYVLAMFLAFEQSVGQSPAFSLKPEQTGLWIFPKRSLEVIEGTLQTILND